MTTKIGTGPQDIPLNQFLGQMAFMDKPPIKPAFQATLSSNVAHASGTNILPYNTVIFDTFGNYNTSTYTFTASVSGLYFFHINLNLYSNPGAMMAGIRANGVYYFGTRVSSTISGDNNVESTAIVFLDVGQTAQPYSVNQGNSASLSNSVSWNRFEGYLIY